MENKLNISILINANDGNFDCKISNKIMWVLQKINIDFILKGS